jgi:hypothetical protein
MLHFPSRSQQDHKSPRAKIEQILSGYKRKSQMLLHLAFVIPLELTVSSRVFPYFPHTRQILSFPLPLFPNVSHFFATKMPLLLVSTSNCHKIATTFATK